MRLPMHATIPFLQLCRTRLAEAGVPASALFFPLIVTPLSLVWLSQVRLGLDWETAWPVALKWALLAAFVSYCAVRLRLRPLAGLVGAWTTILMAFAAVSLPSALPFFEAQRLWDPTFLVWDRALGIDHLALFANLAAWPAAVDALNAVYFKTPHLVMLTPVLLVALGRYDRLREFLWLFAWTLAAVTAIAAFFPAKGLLAGLDMTADARAMLPAGAGDYHLRLVDHLISGRARLYDITSNPGVIVFPSFHFCMAALLARAFRGIRILGPSSAILAALIVVSIVPIGGHYVVDGLASIPILVAAAAIHRRLAVARIAPADAAPEPALSLTGIPALPSGR
jgi:hypothetical protein